MTENSPTTKTTATRATAKARVEKIKKLMSADVDAKNSEAGKEVFRKKTLSEKNAEDRVKELERKALLWDVALQAFSARLGYESPEDAHKDFCAAFKANLAGVDKKQARFLSTIDSAVHGAVHRHLDALRKDTITVHRGYQLLISKITVATELAYMRRTGASEYLDAEIMHTLVRAFDEPAAWWEPRKNLSLERWLEVLRKMGETYQQKDQAAKEAGGVSTAALVAKVGGFTS